jgi:hypothetical protein
MMTRVVKELVGELDFSFHVINTAGSSKTVLAEQDDDLRSHPDGFKKKGD